MTINTDKLPPYFASFKRNIQQLQIQNMKYIVKYLEEQGITDEQCQAAILAICCRESRLIPLEEGGNPSDPVGTWNYSVAALKGIWRGESEATYQKYANAKSKGMSKEDFYGYWYGIHKGLPFAEGGKYLGRGFCQITTSACYGGTSKKYLELYGEDPELLKYPKRCIEPKYAHKILVAYFFFKDKNFKSNQSKENIFDYCHRLVNSGEKGNGVAEKRSFYEFFIKQGSGPIGDPGVLPEPKIGDPVPLSDSTVNPKPSNKDGGISEGSPKSREEIEREPLHKQEAWGEDRSANFDKIGFTDPFGKYPLREYMNEQDTNRLARGIIRRTCVEFKDSIRNVNIPTANGNSYNQPTAPFSAQYPYNKVMETESGHVTEYDDTPGAERINIYHRAGTFFEIDNNGSQVNHIVGDGYWITERNGNVYIKGACNVTIESEANIYCRSEANIEVDGNTSLICHDNLDIGVANNMSIAVGKNLDISVGKNYNLEYGIEPEIDPETNKPIYGGMTFKSPGGKLGFESPSDITFKAGAAIKMESTTTTTINSTGDLTLNTNGVGILNAAGKAALIGGTAYVKGATINLKGKVPLEEYVKKTATDSRGDTHTQLTGSGMGTAGSIDAPKVDKIAVKFNQDSIIPPLTSEDDSAVTSMSEAPESNHYPRSKLNRKFPEVRGGHKPIPEQLIPAERSFKEARKYESEEEVDSKTEMEQRRMAAFPDQSDKPKSSDGMVEIDSDQQDPTMRSGDENVLLKDPKQAKSNADKIKDPNIGILIKSTKSFPPSFKISKNFTLGHVTYPGDTAVDIVLPPGKTESGVGTQTYSSQILVENLSILSENVLEVLYEMLGPCRGKFSSQSSTGKWLINDGLRTRRSENGKLTGSDHFKGRAIDFRLDPKPGHKAMYNLVFDVKQALGSYKHLILEYDKGGANNWIHIAYDANNLEKRDMTYNNQVKYKDGFVLLN